MTIKEMMIFVQGQLDIIDVLNRYNKALDELSDEAIENGDVLQSDIYEDLKSMIDEIMDIKEKNGGGIRTLCTHSLNPYYS